MATEMDLVYNAYIEQMRIKEYPMLKDALYLDHAGATLYSKTLMDSFHADMMAQLYGNPHSASASSQRSSHMIDSVRYDTLRLFGADPDEFDLVFAANTTAAIKLVVEAFREQDNGFWYGYHVDSHTSVVGVREAAKQHRCFESDDEVVAWLGQDVMPGDGQRLFAYPLQSNMNGRKLSLKWLSNCRSQKVFSLLDVAASAATSSLRLCNLEATPDFTVLSFAKMFGFPDLGALIVRKDCAHLFQSRQYFGGGTVDMVVCAKEQWHIPKSASLHEQLEDGTLPVHSILALRSAMQTHTELFQSMDRIAQHTSALAKQLYDTLVALRHANGQPVCRVYKDEASVYGDSSTQGPSITFNIRDGQGNWVSNTEVEKLASVKKVHLRTGGLCNPGGVAKHLNLAPWEMHENFSAGYRCGGESDVLNGKPTGVIRVSLGAMSTRSDVAAFMDFMNEFFVEKCPWESAPPSPLELNKSSRFYVESLAVYPIKSCAGWQIPNTMAWDIYREGLAWDREWCIVGKTTGAALSQKSHPRMALIRPQLDFKNGVLRISHASSSTAITVPLSKDPSCFDSDLRTSDASVCGDKIEAKVYTSPLIEDYLTRAVGVPCTLARFPAATPSIPSMRHSKSHLHGSRAHTSRPRPILLSNESPILTISRSSLNRLNETIKARGGKAAHPDVFRANIVLAESPLLPPGQEQPYVEDDWAGMSIGDAAKPGSGLEFDFLGGCRRCQMVCIDQTSAEKNQEPFVTLAKTRRVSGRVLFGVHTALAERAPGSSSAIQAGDVVTTWNSQAT
ncbi:Putative aminotransferase class V domain, molybdenum cofactor sulfurase [Septoria linicola]|uniref:Molybdenum cofactor sulfurase n=1 Tax=Septoria linicola TaxID=215465 RepID=A0A9Q9AYY2_9PEZI|nr:putative aminotransferase class V domain, molybdenum cofactor sulfurase [Septoria linicola]USW57680.1 Putative aminotransferase class V domain, molybdenum cofactor sulfurase [Septoria linicola]